MHHFAGMPPAQSGWGRACQGGSGSDRCLPCSDGQLNCSCHGRRCDPAPRGQPCFQSAACVRARRGGFVCARRCAQAQGMARRCGRAEQAAALTQHSWHHASCAEYLPVDRVGRSARLGPATRSGSAHHSVGEVCGRRPRAQPLDLPDIHRAGVSSQEARRPSLPIAMIVATDSAPRLPPENEAGAPREGLPCRAC